MNRLLAIIPLLLAPSLVDGSAYAQESQRGQNQNRAGQPTPNRPQRAQPSQADIDNYLKHLRQARVEQVKLRLGVSGEKANAIVQRWAELEEPIRKIYPKTSSLWRQMQFILQEASPEREKSRKIKPLATEYSELHKELSAARRRLYEELPKMGDSPAQQVRIMFLMEEMERNERDGIRTSVERRRGQAASAQREEEEQAPRD